jgi:hypothetical protein
MFILVYVDDIIIIALAPTTINDLLQQLQMSFAVKDLGMLNVFLGVEVTSLQSSLLLSQRRYIMDLLKRTNMLEAKPISSPMSSSSSLLAFAGDQGKILRSIVAWWAPYNIYLSRDRTWPL